MSFATSDGTAKQEAQMEEHSPSNNASKSLSPAEDKSLTFRRRRLSLADMKKAGEEVSDRKDLCSVTDEQDSEVTAPPSQEKLEEMNRSQRAKLSPKGTDYHDEEDHDEHDYGYETHEPDFGYDAAEPEQTTDHDQSPLQQQHISIEIDNFSHHSAHSTHSSEADEKAYTFRKRRLSMTTTNSNSSSVHVATSENGNTTTQVIVPDHLVDNNKKRQRRLSQDSSICSNSSLNSDQGSTSAPAFPPSGQKPMRFVSRTLHAGELLPHNGMPPPSPAVNSDNVLYHQNPLPPLQHLYAQQKQLQQQPGVLMPNHAGGGTPAQMMMMYRMNGGLPPGLPPPQPRWKRRKTLCHQTEPHKLPFAADIVGTYSCHGVEPVYDSEYDDEDDEEGGHAMPGSAPVVTMAAKINQDRGGVAYPYGNHPKTALFAVYDGHGQGGESVSQYALYEIQRRIEKHAQFQSDLGTALKETFVAVDDALKYEPLIDPLFAGTTACVAVLRNTTLTLANAGDSRAVLARRVVRGSRNNQLKTDSKESPDDFEYVALNLTHDLNPDVPSEMERILRMGGYVSLPPAPGLSARVWLDPMCTQIGLAMSRSIGDHAVSPAGVIAEPVITTHEVTADDEFIILASDGVWEFISSAQAVRIISDNLERGATKACQALIEAAAARWHEEEGAYRDDITAIVVRLQKLWDDKSDKNSNEAGGSTAVSTAAASEEAKST